MIDPATTNKHGPGKQGPCDRGDDYRQARRDGLEAGMSLAKAINDAGGVFSTKILEMTVADFICSIAAQNHIRFHFEPPALKNVRPKVYELPIDPAGV